MRCDLVCHEQNILFSKGQLLKPMRCERECVMVIFVLRLGAKMKVYINYLQKITIVENTVPSLDVW